MKKKVFLLLGKIRSKMRKKFEYSALLSSFINVIGFG